MTIKPYKGNAAGVEIDVTAGLRCRGACHPSPGRWRTSIPGSWALHGRHGWCSLYPE